MDSPQTVHRAVSPTLCDSYSHTVLSRFTINGVSAVGSSSGTPAMQMRALEFKWCMAICDGGGGGVCMPLIWTCGILWCRTPAMVPPYVGQWCAPTGCRGSVHVDTCVAYAFGTGLCKRKWKCTIKLLCVFKSITLNRVPSLWSNRDAQHAITAYSDEIIYYVPTIFIIIIISSNKNGRDSIHSGFDFGDRAADSIRF